MTHNDDAGHVLSIPMPGHGVSGASEKAAREAVATLTTLIEEHDAVFLLTDSREARWLPTVIAAHQNKICLTAAVGFDTFVAMRHGVDTGSSSSSSEGGGGGGGGAAPARPGARNVGCYFCNDVMAPTDSTKDRSLDQQCTVSRPGISMAVCSAVVEMLVSMLHHPLGVRTSPSPSPSPPLSLSLVSLPLSRSLSSLFSSFNRLLYKKIFFVWLGNSSLAYPVRL